MRFLNKNGWVALHDMLPSNWIDHHVPSVSKDFWTGHIIALAVSHFRGSAPFAIPRRQIALVAQMAAVMRRTVGVRLKSNFSAR